MYTTRVTAKLRVSERVGHLEYKLKRMKGVTINTGADQDTEGRQHAD